MNQRLAFVGCALALVVGCSRSPDGAAPVSTATPEPAPFLGVPEDRTRQIEDENPDIDPRLRGLTTMTEVRTVDDATYARLKKEGRIAQEVRRGAFVYFAVTELRTVPLASGGAGAASGAAVTLVSRYKAPIPKNQ